MSEIKITPEVRTRLVELENEHGQITPEVVVTDAKDKKSPLHDLFDWDVRSAAMKHWLDTARTIIRSVRLVSSIVETTVIKAPHYVRDPSIPGNEQGYISIARLQKDPEAAKASLLLEFGRAEGALTRARQLAEVLALEHEVESLIARVVGLRGRVNDHAA